MFDDRCKFKFLVSTHCLGVSTYYRYHCLETVNVIKFDNLWKKLRSYGHSYNSNIVILYIIRNCTVGWLCRNLDINDPALTLKHSKGKRKRKYLCYTLSSIFCIINMS